MPPQCLVVDLYTPQRSRCIVGGVCIYWNRRFDLLTFASGFFAGSGGCFSTPNNLLNTLIVASDFAARARGRPGVYVRMLPTKIQFSHVPCP